MKRLLIFLLLTTSCFAQNYAKQCRDLGGTWSNFKQRCDQTHKKHAWQDKKWWAGEGVILGMAAVQGAAASRVKSGGTYAFGNQTTNRKIVLFETLVNVPVFTAEHYVMWYAAHDDPSRYWRFAGYSIVPAEDLAIGLWIETHTNWGRKAGPFP